MNFVAPEFFLNKIVIGVNDVYRKYPCTYLVRKEALGAEAAVATGIPLLISEFDCGNRGGNRNQVDGAAWYYDHLNNECIAMDLSIVGTDRIVVSFSTITSAIHIAAYMGAANIMICGHDGGMLDGQINYQGYYPEGSVCSVWYRDWVRQIMNQSRQLRDKLAQVYGCRVHSLNPFIGFDFEGHSFES